jgi:heat shock protein HslJ
VKSKKKGRSTVLQRVAHSFTRRVRTLSTAVGFLLVVVAPAAPGSAQQQESAAPGRHGAKEVEARSTDPRSILNRTWQWESTMTPVERISVPDPQRYTVLLTEDGKLQARFDCNRGGGNYEISEGRLSFGPLVSTRMACPPDSLDGPFMRDLQRVVSFFIQDGCLYLELPADRGTMRFRQAP